MDNINWWWFKERICKVMGHKYEWTEWWRGKGLVKCNSNLCKRCGSGGGRR